MGRLDVRAILADATRGKGQRTAADRREIAAARHAQSIEDPPRGPVLGLRWRVHVKGQEHRAQLPGGIWCQVLRVPGSPGHGLWYARVHLPTGTASLWRHGQGKATPHFTWSTRAKAACLIYLTGRMR